MLLLFYIALDPRIGALVIAADRAGRPSRKVPHWAPHPHVVRAYQPRDGDANLFHPATRQAQGAHRGHGHGLGVEWGTAARGDAAHVRRVRPRGLVATALR